MPMAGIQNLTRLEIEYCHPSHGSQQIEIIQQKTFKHHPLHLNVAKEVLREAIEVLRLSGIALVLLIYMLPIPLRFIFQQAILLHQIFISKR